MKLIQIFLLLTLSASLHAEIHKEALICEQSGEICFYAWPVLPTVKGWEQDRNNSFHYSANTQAPVGSNFGNAESVIYAKAIYKPTQPESKNLDDFIKSDQASFLKNNPALKIQECPSIKNALGYKFKCFSFLPQNAGNWERVAYGEETDKDGNEYYLTFVLSSRNESGYNNTQATYVQFITQYK